jgi:hypothetical protein
MIDSSVDVPELIRRAMRFPIDPVLSRYVKYYGISPEEATRHEAEMKRYLILCAINEGKFYAIQPPIDNLWHTFIIFTKLYTEFCDFIAGRYIHHTPTEACTLTADDLMASYGELLHDYQLLFTEEAPEDVWPRVPESDVLSYTPPCC